MLARILWSPKIRSDQHKNDNDDNNDDDDHNDNDHCLSIVATLTSSY